MDKTQILTNWLKQFEADLTGADVVAAVRSFHPDGYWRDILAFTWNIKTMEGGHAIAHMLEATLENGLCRTLLTELDDLRGHEEPRHKTRPKGIGHVTDRTRQTWGATRARETARLRKQDQPYVVTVGGGQGGIAPGARLCQLRVPNLIVDKNPHAGDSWRNRYRSLVLHDPVGYDHLPYPAFPGNWPVFTPKDKMGDWLECYAKIFELKSGNRRVATAPHMTLQVPNGRFSSPAKAATSRCARSIWCLPPALTGQRAGPTGRGRMRIAARCCIRATIRMRAPIRAKAVSWSVPV